MSTKTSALESAFREAADGGAILGMQMEADQLDLLRDDCGSLPKNVFQLARQRKAGRPPESKNKRNQVLAKLICQQSGDPVLFMSSIYAMPLDQVVELIKLAAPGSGKAPPGDLAVRALSLQLQAAKAVAEYVHSKKPTEVAVDHRVDGTIVGFVAPGQGDVTGAVGEVMKRIGDAVQAGAIDAGQVLDFRIVDGEYCLPDDDGDDA
jgi:hypothetical protein